MSAVENSAFLEKLTAPIGVGVAGVNSSGRQTFVNEAFCRLVGYPAEELVGASPPFGYWADSTRAEMLELLKLGLVGQFPKNGRRLIFRHKRGHEFPVLVHVSATNDLNETAWLSTVVDLSEIERRAISAEKQARALEEAQALAKLGTWEVCDGQLTLSESACQMLRASIADRTLSLAQFQSRVPVDDLKKLRDEAGRNEQFFGEVKFNCFDGSTAWLRVTGSRSPFITDAKTFSGTLLDVTSLKIAQLEKQVAIERYTRALVVGRSVIVESDISGRITYFSDEEGAVFGTSSKQIVGRRLVEFVTASSGMPSFMESGALLEGDGFNRRTDVLVIPREGATPVPGLAMPELIGVKPNQFLRLILVNMTEYRNLERQTELLQRRQLLGQLTAELTHDFANVLAIIQMHADQAGMSSDQSVIARELSVIKDAAQRGTIIGRSLLAAAQDRPIAVKKVDLCARLQSLRSLIKLTLGPLVKLDLLCDAEAWVELDPGAFDSALINICVNARDAYAGKPGSVVITIKRRQQDRIASRDQLAASNSYIAVDVEDKGPGMEPAVLARIFEPFFTTKSAGRGTGLGLPSVLAFARASRGDVLVSSEPGRGTRVSMLFPEVVADHDVVPKVAAKSNPGRLVRILVVDDEEDLLSAVRECLQREGHTVVACSSSQDAAVLLTGDETFDILLTDMAMPGKFNGVDLAAVAIKHHPGARVIFMSGFSGRFPERPDWRVLDKPFSGDDVLNAVTEVLVESASHDDSRS